MSQIQYAHCIKYTAGSPDIAPYSAYETRTKAVSFWVTVLDGEKEFICKDETGRVLGEGESCEGCAHDAAYVLMVESRAAAEAAFPIFENKA